MREHVSRQKKTTTGFSIPSLKHPTRGFGLESSAISRQAVPEIQPLTHDISRIPLRTQAKLSISQPGDIYEQEADSVAQQVMQRMAQPVNRQSIQREALPDSEELQMKPLANSITPLVQRQEVPEDEEELQMKPMVQRQAEAGMDTAPDLEASINQARGGGQLMADNIREPMEQAFGADFSGVKVHTDGQSDQLNRSIQARAFTTGQDVFFRQGEYNPGSRGGQELLAHELTHVVQQNGGAVQLKPQMRTIVTVQGDMLQRAELYQFQDKTGKTDMTYIGNLLKNAVRTAKTIVDTNPILTGVEGREKGYLKTWVETFEEFMAQGEVPDFFYARYGYAIETIATGIFKSDNIGPYEALDQVTYGATRPDIVIRDGIHDVAWLDITSEGSPGHIYNKQGGGWKSKPYVAEVRYNMIRPSEFATTATGNLSEEQKAALSKANDTRAEAAANFAAGRDKMAVLLGNALELKYKQKGTGLARKDVSDVVKNVCKETLSKYQDPIDLKHCVGVLVNIEELEVAGEANTGKSWADWAFSGPRDNPTGRVLLTKLGADKG
ncbi:MAG: DUF4157 domain-containing protein [Nostoc sp.]|uniref:eCIS core domain-containing protein n=1 Tax=Nostoc sp. TaxID=1180 RepID=UPI002FF59624